MGVPKGLLRIAGRPILEYLLDRLAWPGPTLLITAPGREHPPGWERFDREAVDRVSKQGPLRGVLTALESSATQWAAIVTVDMPAVHREQIELLGASLGEPTLGMMFRRRDAHAGQIVEPFPLLVRAGALSAIRGKIGRGALSVMGLLEEPGFAALDAPGSWGEAVWTNLNRPADMAAFLSRAGIDAPTSHSGAG